MAGLSVVHDSPGRLRLRLPRVARIDGAEEALLERAGVVACTWTPLTRSLLIRYRPDATTPPTLIDAVAAHTGASAEAVADSPPVAPATPIVSSDITRAIRQAAADANASVARATRGAMDLRVLLPLILAAWAVREVVRGRAGPIAWSTALWYAHGLFRDYNLPGDPE
jgi:Heavy metal associated domain 2